MDPPPPNLLPPTGDPPNSSASQHVSPPPAQQGTSEQKNISSSSPTQQLGFQPPPPATAMPASSDQSSDQLQAPCRPDGSLPDGRGKNIALEKVGFPPDSAVGPLTTTAPGRFPKISSNFDHPAHAPAAAPILPTEKLPPGPRNPNPAQQENNHAETSRSREKTAPPPRKDKQPASFADITARRAAKPPDLFTHNFNAIKPVKMNEGLTILMPPQMYEQRLLSFQYALIGRLLLPPGAAPRTPEDLKGELSRLFQTLGDWVFMPLGKGFFSLKFLLPEDQLKASRLTSWKLSTGILQIRDWKPYFDPYKELSSTAQVWVRLYHLPAEFWHPEFLVGIFRAVGNVIKLDGNTAQGLVGHFARALVEIDLINPLLDSVRVGLPDNLFYVDFSYENVPLLCSFCHFVGHTEDRCRKAKAAASEPPDAPAEKAPPNPRGRKNRNQRWEQKPKEPEQPPPAAAPDNSQPAKDPPAKNLEMSPSTTHQESVPTRNAFQALQLRDEEDESVPETPSSPSYFLRDAHDQDDVVVPESPTADAMEIVTTYAPAGRPPQDSPQQLQEAKRLVIEKAREITRRRQLRQELNSSLHNSSDVSIPANLVGQPRPHNIAPNSPHPAHEELASKLQEATNMGQLPTAFEVGPDGSKVIKDMEHVVHKRWKYVSHPGNIHNNSDDSDDDSTGDPPDSNPHNSQ